MRRALIALAGAVLVLGITTGIFLALEPAVGPMFAFWPGFLAQSALESAGVPITNRALPWASLLFWWVVLWAAWSLALLRRPSAA